MVTSHTPSRATLVGVFFRPKFSNGDTHMNARVRQAQRRSRERMELAIVVATEVMFYALPIGVTAFILFQFTR